MGKKTPPEDPYFQEDADVFDDGYNDWVDPQSVSSSHRPKKSKVNSAVGSSSNAAVDGNHGHDSISSHRNGIASASTLSRNSDLSIADMRVKERRTRRRKSSEDLLEVEWENDKAVSKCYICSSSFSMVKRKHHCRNCGRVICSDCSVFLLLAATNRKHRVCSFCSQTGIESGDSSRRQAPAGDTRDIDPGDTNMRKGFRAGIRHVFSSSKQEKSRMDPEIDPRPRLRRKRDEGSPARPSELFKNSVDAFFEEDDSWFNEALPARDDIDEPSRQSKSSRKTSIDKRLDYPVVANIAPKRDKLMEELARGKSFNSKQESYEALSSAWNDVGDRHSRVIAPSLSSNSHYDTLFHNHQDEEDEDVFALPDSRPPPPENKSRSAVLKGTSVTRSYRQNDADLENYWKPTDSENEYQFRQQSRAPIYYEGDGRRMRMQDLPSTTSWKDKDATMGNRRYIESSELPPAPTSVEYKSPPVAVEQFYPPIGSSLNSLYNTEADRMVYDDTPGYFESNLNTSREVYTVDPRTFTASSNQTAPPSSSSSSINTPSIRAIETSRAIAPPSHKSQSISSVASGSSSGLVISNPSSTPLDTRSFSRNGISQMSASNATSNSSSTPAKTESKSEGGFTGALKRFFGLSSDPAPASTPAPTPAKENQIMRQAHPSNTARSQSVSNRETTMVFSQSLQPVTTSAPIIAPTTTPVLSIPEATMSTNTRYMQLYTGLEASHDERRQSYRRSVEDYPDNRRRIENFSDERNRSYREYPPEARDYGNKQPRENMTDEYYQYVQDRRTALAHEHYPSRAYNGEIIPPIPVHVGSQLSQYRRGGDRGDDYHRSRRDTFDDLFAGSPHSKGNDRGYETPWNRRDSPERSSPPPRHYRSNEPPMMVGVSRFDQQHALVPQGYYDDRMRNEEDDREEKNRGRKDRSRRHSRESFEEDSEPTSALAAYRGNSNLNPVSTISSGFATSAYTIPDRFQKEQKRQTSKKKSKKKKESSPRKSPKRKKSKTKQKKKYKQTTEEEESELSISESESDLESSESISESESEEQNPNDPLDKFFGDFEKPEYVFDASTGSYIPSSSIARSSSKPKSKKSSSKKYKTKKISKQKRHTNKISSKHSDKESSESTEEEEEKEVSENSDTSNGKKAKDKTIKTTKKQNPKSKNKKEHKVEKLSSTANITNEVEESIVGKISSLETELAALKNLIQHRQESDDLVKAVPEKSSSSSSLFRSLSKKFSSQNRRKESAPMISDHDLHGNDHKTVEEESDQQKANTCTGTPILKEEEECEEPTQSTVVQRGEDFLEIKKKKSKQKKKKIRRDSFANLFEEDSLKSNLTGGTYESFFQKVETRAEKKKELENDSSREEDEIDDWKSSTNKTQDISRQSSRKINKHKKVDSIPTFFSLKDKQGIEEKDQTQTTSAFDVTYAIPESLMKTNKYSTSDDDEEQDFSISLKKSRASRRAIAQTIRHEASSVRLSLKLDEPSTSSYASESEEDDAQDQVSKDTKDKQDSHLDSKKNQDNTTPHLSRRYSSRHDQESSSSSSDRQRKSKQKNSRDVIDELFEDEKDLSALYEDKNKEKKAEKGVQDEVEQVEKDERNQPAKEELKLNFVSIEKEKEEEETSSDISRSKKTFVTSPIAYESHVTETDKKSGEEEDGDEVFLNNISKMKEQQKKQRVSTTVDISVAETDVSEVGIQDRSSSEEEDPGATEDMPVRESEIFNHALSKLGRSGKKSSTTSIKFFYDSGSDEDLSSSIFESRKSSRKLVDEPILGEQAKAKASQNDADQEQEKSVTQFENNSVRKEEAKALNLKKDSSKQELNSRIPDRNEQSEQDLYSTLSFDTNGFDPLDSDEESRKEEEKSRDKQLFTENHNFTGPETTKTSSSESSTVSFVETSEVLNDKSIHQTSSSFTSKQDDLPFEEDDVLVLSSSQRQRKRTITSTSLSSLSETDSTKARGSIPIVGDENRMNDTEELRESLAKLDVNEYKADWQEMQEKEKERKKKLQAKQRQLQHQKQKSKKAKRFGVATPLSALVVAENSNRKDNDALAFSISANTSAEDFALTASKSKKNSSSKGSTGSSTSQRKSKRRESSSISAGDSTNTDSNGVTSTKPPPRSLTEL